MVKKYRQHGLCLFMHKERKGKEKCFFFWQTEEVGMYGWVNKMLDLNLGVDGSNAGIFHNNM